MKQSEVTQKLEELKGTFWIRRQLAVAVDCALIGLVCILLFLWNGFGAWSMGLGMFIGIPLVVLGVILYLSAVGFDLKRSGAL
jgi:multidrug efflux pump subunit AcrB